MFLRAKPFRNRRDPVQCVFKSQAEGGCIRCILYTAVWLYTVYRCIPLYTAVYCIQRCIPYKTVTQCAWAVYRIQRGNAVGAAVYGIQHVLAAVLLI